MFFEYILVSALVLVSINLSKTADDNDAPIFINGVVNDTDNGTYKIITEKEFLTASVKCKECNQDNKDWCCDYIDYCCDSSNKTLALRARHHRRVGVCSPSRQSVNGLVVTGHVLRYIADYGSMAFRVARYFRDRLVTPAPAVSSGASQAQSQSALMQYQYSPSLTQYQAPQYISQIQFPQHLALLQSQQLTSQLQTQQLASQLIAQQRLTQNQRSQLPIQLQPSQIHIHYPSRPRGKQFPPSRKHLTIQEQNSSQSETQCARPCLLPTCTSPCLSESDEDPSPSPSNSQSQPASNQDQHSSQSETQCAHPCLLLTCTKPCLDNDFQPSTNQAHDLPTVCNEGPCTQSKVQHLNNVGNIHINLRNSDSEKANSTSDQNA